MKNPKLSKELREAFDSPPGSTKRKKASMIIKTMNASSVNKFGRTPDDGQGGAARPYVYTAQPPKQTEKKESEATPQRKRTLLIPNPVSYRRESDGKGGAASPFTLSAPAKTQTVGQSILGYAKPAVSALNALSQGFTKATQPIVTAPIKAADFLINKGADVARSNLNAPSALATGLSSPSVAATQIAGKILNAPTGTASYEKQFNDAINTAADAIVNSGAKVGDFLPQFKKLYGTKTEAEVNNKLLTAIKAVKSKPLAGAKTADVVAGATQAKSSGAITDNKNGTYTYINKDGTTHTGKWGDNYTDRTSAAPQAPGAQPGQATQGALGPEFKAAQEAVNQSAAPQVEQVGEPSAATPSSGTTTGSATMKYTSEGAASPETTGTPGTTGSLSDQLTQAVEYGVGPATFSQQMLSPQNKKILAEFLGVDESYLPDSNLLYANANDIIAERKKEFQIDELQQQLADRIAAGNTLGDDLKTYIATRDEAVASLDDMMSATRERMKGMDMADPTNIKDMSNYMNYLTVLKGRQQKRYTDFANQSINQYNAQTEQLQALYDSNWAKYKDELEAFKNDQTQAEAVYKRLDSMLQDLYSNVENRDMRDLEKYELQLKINKYAEDSANDAALAALGGGSYVLKDRDFYKAAFEEGAIRNVTNVPDPAGGTKDLQIYDTNIADLINQVGRSYVTEDRLGDANGATEYYGAHMKDVGKATATTAPDSGQFNEATTTYLNRLKEFWAEAGRDENGNIDTTVKSNIESMLKSLSSGIYAKVKGELQGDSGKAATVVSALSDLAGKTSMFGKPRTWSEAAKYMPEWRKENEGKLNSVVLDSIEELVKNNQSSDLKDKTVNEVLTNAVNTQYSENPEWRKTTVESFSPDDLVALIMDKFSSNYIFI